MQLIRESKLLAKSATKCQDFTLQQTLLNKYIKRDWWHVRVDIKTKVDTKKKSINVYAYTYAYAFITTIKAPDWEVYVCVLV